MLRLKTLMGICIISGLLLAGCVGQTVSSPEVQPTQASQEGEVVGGVSSEDSGISSDMSLVCKPVRLRFEDSDTNISQDGVVASNSTCRYIFWGEKDQLIRVDLQSANDIFLSIFDADGRVLQSFEEQGSSYRGYLPAKGNWYVDLKAAPANASYSLYLELPERLNFPEGTTEKTAGGTLPAAGVHNYSIWAAEGQKLSIEVTPTNSFILEVIDVNGRVLLSVQSGSSSFEVVVPELGDYMVNVINQTNAPQDFSLSIEVR
jgi:hypothetical protein